MNAHTTVPALYEVEIEQDLIGAVMCSSRSYWPASEVLTPDDFYDPMHRRLWALIGERVEADLPVDPRMLAPVLRPVAEELHATDNFDLMEYLRGMAMVGSSVNVRAVARTIADLGRRRRIVAEASAAIDAAYYDRETAPDQIADKAGEALYLASHHEQAGNGPEPIGDVVRRAVQQAEDARRNPDRARITTGLPSVDARLGGFFPGHLYILAAPPSMGKSALAAQMCLSSSRAGYVALLFAKEMDSEEVAMRFLAQDAGVAANRLSEGRATDAEIQRAAEASRLYDEGKFLIDGSPSLTVAQMRARAQAIRRREGKVDVVVIDNLRQVRAADPRAPEPQRLDQITCDCKAMAKDLGCAIILVAPLNRELWKRENPRPLISDIYGSSAIEYNADHIWFLFREEFYLERNKPDGSDAKKLTEWTAKYAAAEGLAEVFSAKRRGGPLGSAKLKFDGPLTRFSEIEHAAPSDPDMRFDL